MLKTRIHLLRNRFLLETHELETIILRLLMRRGRLLFQNPEFSTNSSESSEPDQIMMLLEILQEQYNNRPRKASRSRQMRICPYTGRTRGYYNWAKMSRIQFKQLAGAGILPGVRKSSW